MKARNVGPNKRSQIVAAGGPAPSCTVLAETELERYQQIVDNHALRVAEAETKRRDDLRLVSEAHVANWSNTIEAQRQAKIRAKAEREEREEQRRLIIDAEEAELRRSEKEKAVQRANLQLYDQNDRVKNFTSKLFLATVLEEREKQLAIKDEKEKLQRQLDAEWAVQQHAQLRQAAIEEEQKLAGIHSRRMQLRDAQLQQLAEIRTMKIQNRNNNMEQGRRIMEDSKKAAEEEREEEERRRLNDKKKSAELMALNEESKRLREEKARQEKEEEMRIAVFAEQKQEQVLERKRRAEERFAAKLRSRQELIDKQGAALAELKAANEERELRAMRDLDRERQIREEREAEVRERLQKEIAESRKDQLMKKTLAKQQRDAELAKMSEIWRDRAEILINEELQERHETRSKAEQLQHFHLLQRQEKRHQQLLEKRKDIEEGLNLQGAIKEEQDLYNAYVNSVMTDYVRKGRGAELVKIAASRSKTKSA
jgi:hypothetical protein